ncbi:MAG: DUF58 domain-containing protein [Anaerolineae bacterium]
MWRQRISTPSHGSRYIDIESDTQFSDAWITLGLLLMFLGLVLQNPFLSASAFALFLVALTGWLWNTLSLFGLHYERNLSEIRAFRGETINLVLTVRNQKILPLTWLSIVDRFPVELPVNASKVMVNTTTNLGEFHTFWMPGAFQRLQRPFQIECSERGFYTFGPAVVSTGDGFGLFSRRATLMERQQLIVYPHLYSAADLHLPPKNPFGAQGTRGHLFQDPLRTVGIRAWQPADSLHHVHWKATARQQQLLSRAFEPSAEMQVLIFLNVATLVRHWHGYIPELLERVVSVAASLASLTAEQRLPVGLIANGALPNSDQPIRLLPGRSPDQLLHILELLAAVTNFATAPIEEILLREAPRAPWGATLVIVTAIAHDALLAALLDLAGAGRRVVLFTLAAEPPKTLLPGIMVYHLPHLVNDLLAPTLVQNDSD